MTVNRLNCFGVAIVTALCVSPAWAKRASRTWLDRPWEYSYIISIDSPHGMEIERDIGLKAMAKANPVHLQSAPDIFDWSTLHLPPSSNRRNDDENGVAILVIRFDRQGKVLTPYRWTPGLRAHINAINDVILALGNDDSDLQFDLGAWYTGTSGEESLYVPAICTIYDMQERYKKDFDANSPLDGNFGCREWGYYLQSPDYPYIDVTSYQEQGPYIRPVIGWGRFDTPPKPVIGKMVDTWLCLHDCPDNQPPGVIPDIGAWARKHGWPVPKPPEKLPMFPDTEREPGDFVD